MLKDLDLSCRSFVDVQSLPEEFTVSDIRLENVKVQAGRTEWNRDGIQALSLIATTVNGISQ